MITADKHRRTRDLGKGQIDSLKERDKDFDQRIRDLNRDIRILENQQINKKELREVFQEFSELYAGAPLEIKRRLLNVVVEEIRCSAKRGKNTGEIIYKLRRDGSVKKAWESAKKKARSQVARKTQV